MAASRIPAADLVLLCVPDSVIAEVARAIAIGPWVAHVSGATQLAALEPHRLRFSVHPLQTLTRERGAEQLDGAWGAISGESPTTRWRALDGWPRRSGFDRSRSPIRPHALPRGGGHRRELPRHPPPGRDATAGAGRCAAGGDRPAHDAARSRTASTSTGPIARGDWTTVEAHLAALAERAPDLVPLYRALAEATRP